MTRHHGTIVVVQPWCFFKSIFTGEFDARKFLFNFENVVMGTNIIEDTAVQLISKLNGATFNFYFETFVKDGNMT